MENLAFNGNWIRSLLGVTLVTGEFVGRYWMPSHYIYRNRR